MKWKLACRPPVEPTERVGRDLRHQIAGLKPIKPVQAIVSHGA